MIYYVSPNVTPVPCSVVCFVHSEQNSHSNTPPSICINTVSNSTIETQVKSEQQMEYSNGGIVKYTWHSNIQPKSIPIDIYTSNYSFAQCSNEKKHQGNNCRYSFKMIVAGQHQEYRSRNNTTHIKRASGSQYTILRQRILFRAFLLGCLVQRL